MTSPTEERLIVGLGNPGNKYEYTRHNLGFLVLKRLSQQLNIKFSESSFTKSVIASGSYEDRSVTLMAPMTFMNKSGVALRQYREQNPIDLSKMLVVCDDLNLPFGQIRVRGKGSDGGHNGLTSVIELLRSEEFPRLRMGIGQPRDKGDTVDFVLEEFDKQERTCLDDFIGDAADCCLVWCKDGIQKAMEKYNTKK